jgi:Mg-chelatase subunit ChlI
MLKQRIARAAPEAVLEPRTDPAEVLAMRASLERVEVDDDLLGYIISLITATRAHPQVQVGSSPRGGLALVQLARAHAVLRDRDYVVPEDVKAVAVPALAHRITLRPELWVRRISADDIVGGLVQSVPAPHTTPAAARRAGAASTAGPAAGAAAGQGANQGTNPGATAGTNPATAAKQPAAGQQQPAAPKTAPPAAQQPAAPKSAQSPATDDAVRQQPPAPKSAQSPAAGG